MIMQGTAYAFNHEYASFFVENKVFCKFLLHIFLQN